MAQIKNNNKEIIVYSHTTLILVANILLVFFLLLFVGLKFYVFTASNSDIQVFMPYLAIPVLPLLILYYIGSRKIIFDKEGENIYLKYLFYRKKLFSFTEVNSLKLVGGSTYTYSMYTKSDPYGKGVSLVLGTSLSRLSSFEREILPQIEELLLPYFAEAKEDVYSDDIRSYEYYTTDRNTINLNRYGLIHALLLISIGGVFLVSGMIGERAEMKLVSLPMFLLGLTNWTRRKYFDIEGKSFNTSYWYFIKRKYPLT